MTAQQNNENETPQQTCGTSQCIAERVGVTLENQNAANLKFIEKLFDTNIKFISLQITNVETSLTKQVEAIDTSIMKHTDEIYVRLRKLESFKDVVINETRITKEGFDFKLKQVVDENEQVVWICEKRKSYGYIFGTMVALAIIAIIGWGLFIFHEHPMASTSISSIDNTKMAEQPTKVKK
jgi:hypothetical protein